MSAAPSDFWGPHMIAQKADPVVVDRDAAVFATAEDGRAGIDGDTAARAYRRFAVAAVAVMLVFVAWQLGAP